MRVKFNGLVETRSKGCKPCGKARGESSMTFSKLFHLPSGKSIMFHRGRVYDVSDSDGAFLMDYNNTRKVFEEV